MANISRRKTFTVLFFSIFVSISGVGIVVPLLPVYSYNLGATGFAVSMIFAGFALVRTFCLPFFGHLSDKSYRKPYIMFGLLVYAFVGLAFVFAHNIHQIIGIRLVQGVASSMIIPVSMAYVGDITPQGKEGFYTGLFNMATFISLSIGPVAGGLINDYYSMDTSFFLMAIFCFLAFFLALFMLPKAKDEKKKKYAAPPLAFIEIIKDKNLIALFLYRFVFTTSIGTIWCFLPIYASKDFNFSSFTIGILVGVGIFTSGLLNIPMGYISDKISKSKMILTGGLIVALSLFCLAFARNFSEILISMIVFGIGGGISTPALMTMSVIKGKQVGKMASVLSLITMAHSLGMFFGSILAGITMDFFQLKYTFPISSFIVVIGSIFFYILISEKDFCNETLSKDSFIKREEVL